jgi:hypothetical protein
MNKQLDKHLVDETIDAYVDWRENASQCAMRMTGGRTDPPGMARQPSPRIAPR